MNILTKDNQCEYKAKRSTSDAIYYIKQNFIRNKIIGHISFDLSKAFGWIDRNGLWRILYEKGTPTKLIDIAIKGSTSNAFLGKLDGVSGEGIGGNKGVFEGSPISALLNIVFADGIMGEYKNGLEKSTPKIKTMIKRRRRI